MMSISFRKVLLVLASVTALVLLIASSAAFYFIKANRNLLGASGEKYQSGRNQPESNVLKPGTVGEVKDNDKKSSGEDSASSFQLPPVVFNASGTITEIKSDRLIVSGEGSNFADKTPRTLNVVFTPETATFASSDQKTKYQGAEGLKHLKTGAKVLVEGDENIRGKIEFKARTINVLPQ